MNTHNEKMREEFISEYAMPMGDIPKGHANEIADFFITKLAQREVEVLLKVDKLIHEEVMKSKHIPTIDILEKLQKECLALITNK